MKINQRKDGLYYTSKMYKGERFQFTSTNKEEVKKQVAEFENNILNNNVVINDNGLLVKQWSNEWLKTYKNNVEKATYDMYEQAIRLYIIPYIGNIKLKNLKEKDIMNMINKLEEKGITRKRDVALLTINQILNTAINNDYISKNVASTVKIKKYVSPEKKPIPDEYTKIIKKYAALKNYCFMTYFMIYTGLRREEVIPLTYEDIDLKNNTIHIHNAVHFEKNQPILKNTKNEEERFIPLLDNIKQLLDSTKSGLIFPNQYGKMMSETSFKRRIEYTNNLIKKELSKECENFTAHQLRHTYACILHKAKIPLKEAQYFMGHKDIKMLLEIYTHLDNQDKENAKNALNNFINNQNFS